MKKKFAVILGLIMISHGISYAGDVTGQISKNSEILQKVQMTKETTPKYLYKVISVEDWQDSQQKNHVVNSTLDHPFIHLATENQLPHIKQKFWKGKRYFILKLDPQKMQGHLVFETNPGGTIQYYHLYEGIIPLDAVIDISPADSL